MRKNGQYEAKVKDPQTGRRKSFYSSISKEDAIEKGLRHFGKGDTLADYYATVYLPSIVHRSIGYIRGIGKSMEKHVLPRFGHLSLEDVNRHDVQRFFNGLDMKPSTMKLVKKHFSGVMKLALIDGMVYSNPVSYVRTPPCIDERKPITLDEARKMLESGRHTNAVVLGLLGLRPGEICAASWADVSAQTLYVHSQVVEGLKGWTVSETLKTPQSERHVPIPDALASLMSKGGILMVGGNTKQLWRELKSLAGSLGIEGFTTHRLRHTCVSLMENDVCAPRRVVSQITGKARIGEMDRYSTASKASRQKWADKYAAYLLGEYDKTTTATLSQA